MYYASYILKASIYLLAAFSGSTLHSTVLASYYSDILVEITHQ